MPLNIGPVNAAIPTPLKSDGHFDPDSMAAYIDRLVRIGLHGVMVLGTMGEGRFLSNADRESMIAHTVEHVAGRLIVFATVADVSRALMVERAQRYSRMGVDAVVICVTPNRPAQRGIADVKAVADAATVPCAYYDIPENTGVKLDLAQILDILQHPNIRVMKDSSQNDVLAQALPVHRPDGVAILHGSEYRAAHSRLLGYDGWLHGGGALSARNLNAINEAVLQGRIQDALALERENALCIATIYNRLYQPLQNIIAQKYALQILGAFRQAYDADGQTLPDDAKPRVQEMIRKYPWLAMPGK